MHGTSCVCLTFTTAELTSSLTGETESTAEAGAASGGAACCAATGTVPELLVDAPVALAEGSARGLDIVRAAKWIQSMIKAQPVMRLISGSGFQTT